MFHPQSVTFCLTLHSENPKIRMYERKNQMESLGLSRVAARGQITVPLNVRNLYGLREDDSMEFMTATVKELARWSPEKLCLVVIPKRHKDIEPEISSDLRETKQQIADGTSIRLEDVVGELQSKER
jgi:bifunctional DNA-binding transcriptional regulator/antitoxin component of YhaV-PrlF toxin-antitoxin module